ncbi:hypothetical protein MIR68_002783 [Amoeboaphelidium protococcarum]|nr:hypothetical protein MIR68_002783 [Amoeboaphelidium protococcarum]
MAKKDKKGKSPSQTRASKIPEEPMLKNVVDKRAKKQNSKPVAADERPLSMFVQPGLQLQTRERAQSSAPSVVSNSTDAKSGVTENTANASKKTPAAPTNSAPLTVSSNAQSSSKAVPSAGAQMKNPTSMQEAMQNFKLAKKQAEKNQKYKLNSTQRLIDAMADVMVLLLTRAMCEGIDEKIEIRIYKKPQNIGSGMAVAEYRDGRDAKEKGQKTTNIQNLVDNNDDFSILLSNELTLRSINQQTPDGYKALDCADNWKQFYDVVQKFSLWFRFCLAVHKRIGWKCVLDRSMLNGMDSRFLGFVTIKISKFV